MKPCLLSTHSSRDRLRPIADIRALAAKRPAIENAPELAHAFLDEEDAWRSHGDRFRGHN